MLTHRTSLSIFLCFFPLVFSVVASTLAIKDALHIYFVAEDETLCRKAFLILIACSSLSRVCLLLTRLCPISGTVDIKETFQPKSRSRFSSWLSNYRFKTLSE